MGQVTVGWRDYAFFKEKGKTLSPFLLKKGGKHTYKFFHSQDLQRMAGLVIESLAIHWSCVRLLLTSIPIF